MHDPGIATAADYADAMMTARRSKNILVLLLILVLLAEMGLFFTMRFSDVVPNTSASTIAASTTQPARDWSSAIHYVLGGCLFLGVSLSIILGFVVLLIVNIMLVGRLIGVARLTGAYILCLLLMLLLFPWQAFLNNVGLTPDKMTFKIPGVLYTWPELTDAVHGARFANSDINNAILGWGRFVVAGQLDPRLRAPR
jgi:hypothetical protein